MTQETAETTVKMGVSPNIHRYIELAITQQDGRFLCAGETPEDRIASYKNWAVVYLIATVLTEQGLTDEDVQDYSLRLVSADGEEVDA